MKNIKIFLFFLLCFVYTKSISQTFETSKTKYIAISIEFTKKTDIIETLKIPKCIILERENEQDLLLCYIPTNSENEKFKQNESLIIKEIDNFWFIQFNKHKNGNDTITEEHNKINITFKSLCGNYVDHLSQGKDLEIGGNKFVRFSSELFDLTCIKNQDKNCKNKKQFKKQAENRLIANKAFSCSSDSVKEAITKFIKKNSKSKGINYSFDINSVRDIKRGTYIIKDSFGNIKTLNIENFEISKDKLNIKLWLKLFNGKI